MERITVFTPAYNRAYCLHKCYESLKRQSRRDFCWMIIDDGSSDNTAELVNGWIADGNDFDITYIRKENGGLHTAYNEAIANIRTELSICIDSDDWMPDHAIETILTYWDQHGTDAVAGIAGLDCDISGNVLGDPFPDRKTINLIDLQTGKYKIRNGDRKLVVRTELYRQVFPMEVFPGEKNFNPHYMHLQISQKYDFLVLNQPLCIVDYQPDGMTASMLKQYRSSPNSFMKTRQLYLAFPNTGFAFRLRHSIHYVSSCILAKKWNAVFKETPHPLIALMAFPFGILLSIVIRVKG